MNKAILNIGLNVGDVEPTYQLRRTLNSVMTYDIISNVKVVEKKGSKASDWVDERTLVVEIINSMGKDYFQSLLQVICAELKQDAISYKTSLGIGGLVFNETYKGERYEFKEEYFINF
jgi:hypothetical protein